MQEENIILASQEGNLGEIKRISDISDMCDFRDEYGRTMLHYACWNGQYKIAQYLHELNELKPNVQDNYGFTPLHLVHFEHKDYLPGLSFEDYYKNDYSRNTEEKDFPSNVAIGKYPFKHVNIKNKIEISKLLVSSGADVNSRNKFDCTPLHYVAANGDVDVLRLLIKNGADVNAENMGGASPLFDAVRYNNLEAVKILVEKGSDIRCSTFIEEFWGGHEEYSFPLYEACYRGFFDIARCLIEQGAEVNQVNDEGNSPLSVAMSGRKDGRVKKEIVYFLLENGADINIGSRTPFSSSIYRADYEILDELFERDVIIPQFDDGSSLAHFFVAARSNTSAQRKVILNNEECMRNDELTLDVLLRKGYDINGKNNKGETPLNMGMSRSMLKS